MGSSAVRIADALVDQSETNRLDLRSVKAALDRLADSVVIDSIDADPAAITVRDDETFVGEGVVYLADSQIAGKAQPHVELPLHFEGSVSNTGDIKFNSIRTDVTPLVE